MIEFYKGKRVFLTGYTGFKGAWLSLWLRVLGAEVFGYALAPNAESSMFAELGLDNVVTGAFADIRDIETLKHHMSEFKPEIVFHLAARPLVRLSYEQPVLTYQTNVMGTLNLLECCRRCPTVKAVVNITTDKCYENKEISRGYREDEPMGGHDMYSSSKGCVEIMAASYRRSFLQHGQPFALACARAGNVIGGGDWARDRLIPDCIQAIISNETIDIRSPGSVRPWQHVLEPLSGYLRLGRLLYESGEWYASGFNFGPGEDDVWTVARVAEKITEFWGKGEVVFDSDDELHEAGLLLLNIEKAREVLNWHPKYGVSTAVKKNS